MPERLLERDPEQDRRIARWRFGSNSLPLAILVSVSLHLGIVFYFLTFAVPIVEDQLSKPSLVKINLLPSRSYESLVEPVLSSIPTPETSQRPAESNLTPEALTPEYAAQPIQSPEPVVTDEHVDPPVSPVKIDIPAVVDSITNDQSIAEDRLPQVNVPTTLALRQVVRSLTEQATESLWLTDCSVEQQKSELIECRQDKEIEPDVPGNSQAFRYFNQPRQSGRAGNAQALLARNLEGLRASLATAGLDAATDSYILEEVEAGISVYSGTGNVPLQRLENQIYANDPAYQQMRRVLGSP